MFFIIVIGGPSPPDTAVSIPPTNPEGVFIAPAINVVSDNIYGLDLFVQFSFPAGNQPATSADRGGDDASSSAVGPESQPVNQSSEIRAPSATDFDIKPFIPLLSDDDQGQGNYCNHVAAKATYVRLLHGKIGFLGFFSPSSVKMGRTHIVLG